MSLNLTINDISFKIDLTQERMFPELGSLYLVILYFWLFIFKMGRCLLV